MKAVLGSSSGGLAGAIDDRSKARQNFVLASITITIKAPDNFRSCQLLRVCAAQFGRKYAGIRPGSFVTTKG